MACKERQTSLQDYLTGDLAPAQAGELKAHLHDCKECSRDLEAYRLVIESLPAMPEPVTPARLHDDVMAALEPHVATWHKQRESSLHAALRRAVAVLVAAAFGVSLSVALWGWMGRIGSFAAHRFSQDLTTVWETSKDLWFVFGLLADVVRTLEPTAAGLWEVVRRLGQPVMAWSPLILTGYVVALAIGSWLCWRAFHQADERRWSHAA